jgi:hypothetical protein
MKQKDPLSWLQEKHRQLLDTICALFEETRPWLFSPKKRALLANKTQ